MAEQPIFSNSIEAEMDEEASKQETQDVLELEQKAKEEYEEGERVFQEERESLNESE